MKKHSKSILIVLYFAILILIVSIIGGKAFYKITVKDIPVLLYHCITEDEVLATSNSLYITKDKFEKDLIYLKENGYTTIFAKDLDKPLPEKPIVITFDDGYKDNYILGYPLLKKYEMKATIFILAYTLDEKMPHKLSWEEAKYLADSGVVDIQSHTYDLHYSNEDGTVAMHQSSDESDEEYRRRIFDDIDKMNDRFDKYLGYRPTIFAYPFGKYTQKSEAVFNEAGYKITFTTESRIGNDKEDLSLFPRLAVQQSTNLDTILKKKGK